MGDVEPGHPERDPRFEDDRGSLRVGPDVELGRGRGVARPERAAHQRDPGDPLVQRRRRPQQQGDVGQRPRGDDGHRLIGLAQERRHQLDRRDVGRPDRRLRQVRAVEPGIAVELDRDPRLAHQRTVRAGRDGHVRPSEQGQDTQGVARRAIERGVARDRRDRAQPELRPGQREDDREGVVMTRVAVEDDRDAGHCRSVAQALPRGDGALGPLRLPPGACGR